jgi:nitrous oxidase accessory protein
VRSHSLLTKAFVVGIISLFIVLAGAPSINATIMIPQRMPCESEITSDKGTLSGYVTDTAMNPIKGALVRVYFHNTSRENYSDATGYYHVTDIPICYCMKNATCCKPGYISSWVLLSISQNTTYDFVLTRTHWFYVGGSDPGNYSKIQDAIDNASPGDTVFVYDDASPYKENVSIKIPLTVLGEDKNTTVIDAGSVDYARAVVIQADHVVFEGFRFNNTGWDSYGISIIHAEDITITTNLFSDSTGGAYIENSDQLEINDNVFSNVRIALNLVGCADARITRNQVVNNIVGFSVGAINTEVVDNVFTNNTDAIEAFGANMSIQRNIIKSTRSFGIELTEASYGSRIQHNIITGNYYGVFAVFALRPNISISFNTFANNLYGFASDGCSQIEISKNNFISNEKDAYFKSRWYQANHWDGNYWASFHGTGPKAIRGTVQIFFIPRFYPKPWINFHSPWLNFDRHPAHELIDIGCTV